MSSIRITSTPAGEAPEWVREAWVGVEMSIHGLEKDGARSIGVLGGAPSPENKNGYMVSFESACRALELAGKLDALRWWRRNSIASDASLLVFGQQFCEYLP